mgnify:CR=1 FL=1
MAVIRQQTQVFNKPVGVRRINTGEAELWEQVAVAGMSYGIERVIHQRKVAAPKQLNKETPK